MRISLVPSSRFSPAETFLEDIKGETVLMGFSSQASDFDKFALRAQKVIDTVAWRSWWERAPKPIHPSA
jgi:hypothetical protein